MQKVKRLPERDFNLTRDLATIANASPVMIWASQKDTQRTYFNKQWLEFTGKTLEQEYGMGWANGIHPEDYSITLEKYISALEKKEEFKFEYCLRRYDGEYRWVLDNGSPYYDNTNQFAGYLGSCIDITEQKRSEIELKRYKELLEHAQTAGNIGTFEWDMISNKVWISDEEKRLLGLSPKDKFKTIEDWNNAIYKNDRKRVINELNDCIKHQKDLVTEFRVIHPDKEIRWLLCKTIIYYDERGTPLKMVGINYDITGRKQLIDTLEFIDTAGNILSTSLDYQVTLNRVAQLAVPHIADWCSVELLDSNGNLEQVAIAHKNPKKVKWAKKYREMSPPDLNAKSGLAKVLKSGKSELYSEISDEMLKLSSKNEETYKLAKRLNLTSAIIVPVNVQHNVIGTITLISAESHKKYTLVDLQMAEQLAYRASLAIENSRLYSVVQQERERLQQLVANVPGVVWEAWGNPSDNFQRIDFVSKHVEELLGYTQEEWLSKPNFWLQIVHPDDKERAAAESREIFTKTNGGISRFRWIKKSGDIIWVEAHSYVIKDTNGKPIGMRGVTMNITERMENEKRKDDFISMASHELKTPLTSLKVYTQLLNKSLKGTSNKKPLLYVEKMESQINKLTKLVIDLLDISKIQTGRLDLKKEKFDLNTLTKEVGQNMQQIAQGHKISINGKVKKKIYADRERISQVLINIISNAIKYSKKSKPIKVKLKENHKEVVVAVQDFGIGISKDEQEKIFERFYQAQELEGKENTYPGLGIGLFISKEIAQRHGGDIELKSKKGEGSTFYLRLPLKANA